MPKLKKGPLNKLTLAWLALAVLGGAAFGLVGWLVVGISSPPFSSYILSGLVVLGLLPGIFGAFGLRFVGLVGIVGIPLTLLWAIIDAFFFHGGYIWPFFFMMNMAQGIVLSIGIGCLAEFFLCFRKPKKRRNYAYGVD